MSKLFICEKPSLAAAVAENLGTPVKKDGYFEVEDNFVAWLRGHIMELANAEEYNPDFKKWSYDTLPIIPVQWQKNVKSTSNYPAILKTVQALLQQAEQVINVGDPDREGQLLVDEVLEYCGNTKPTSRLFINAMDNVTINRALEQMEDNSSAKNRQMYAAALGRERTDWLIGINATRKYTLDAGQLIRVGRVKTCILGLVNRRNEQIETFKPIKHYQVQAYFRTNSSVPFCATWQPGDTVKGLDEEGRLVDILVARSCEQKVTGKTGMIISCITKEGTTAAPLPFSLSTLQRAAGPALGFSPSKVLELAQILYEKKLTTYPRSDSNFIPESQYADAPVILDNLKLTGNAELLSWANGADKSIKSKTYNTSKIDAHHAIIPTMEKIDLSTLQEDEQKLYTLIAKQFILQFYPVHKFEAVTAIIDCEGETFIAKGKTVIEQGWKAITTDVVIEAKDDEPDKALPPLKENDTLTMASISIAEKSTTPPQRFTQDTLIGALTQAHKYVKNKDLAQTVKEIKGIGTEATRSTIIDDLIKAGQLIEKTAKKKKELYVSDAVKELLACLPDELTYPDKTALMEVDLDKIAQGNLSLNDYMQNQAEYVRELMQLPSKFTPKQSDNPVCPVCHKGRLYQHTGKFGKFWSCSGYKEGCKASFQDDNGRPGIYECPVCKKGVLIKRKGKNDEYFWSCSRYKDGCKVTFSDSKNKPLIKLCPECKTGYLVKRHGQLGDFWACNNYPECKATYESGKTGQPVTKKKNA